LGQVNRQLSLPVGLKDSESFGSFIPGKNAQICEHLKNLCAQVAHDKVSDWLTYLFADVGLGKSHLLYASCQYLESMGQHSFYLSFKEKQQLSPEMLQGLEHSRFVCLDDIDYLHNSNEWQVAVFDLINRVKDYKSCALVITGKQPAQELPFSLADLKSRMSWGTSFQLYSLTDEQRQQALLVKAQHRGINMPPEIAKYLVHHWQRDMPALVASLDLLDEQSLQQQRKLTIPFVKEIFNL
jgi:DnaA family protein